MSRQFALPEVVPVKVEGASSQLAADDCAALDERRDALEPARSQDRNCARAELLATAADVLRSRWPSVRGEFKSKATGRPFTYRFDLPGVLLVFRKNSGELVATSLPGNPAELVDAGGAASEGHS